MIKKVRATILDIQLEMEICSTPGHFHHKPPLVIRLPKEKLEQPTISNHLRQLTNKPIRLLNISLAPGSQKKINQLLLHCCKTVLIVMKQALLKLLTTFLKKHNLLITHWLF